MTSYIIKLLLVCGSKPQNYNENTTKYICGIFDVYDSVLEMFSSYIMT